MDYHHPYNVYPEYYNNAQYTANGGYPINPAFMHHSTNGSEQMRGYHMVNHSSMANGPNQPHHQHPHSYVSSFQQPKRPFQHQSNHQNYSSSSSSMFVPNFLISSGTGLTPTLTPTTLATIEQSFMEMQHSGARDPVTQSGFVPPVVEPANSTNSADHSQDSFGNSSSDAEWEPKSKKFVKEGVNGVDYIVTSTGTVNVAPQRKYTRRNKDEKLPPEEEERRRVRRERNKIAAAKCRQRRVDHTNELVNETDELLAVQSRLESEIQSLKQERDQLEFILQSHQPLCKVNKNKVKSEQVDNRHQACSSPHTNGGHHSNHVPENLSKSSPPTNSASSNNSSSNLTNGTVIINKPVVITSIPATTSSIATARPNSLPLIKRDRARMLSMTSATGVTINTPTSGVSITPSMLFCPDLDTMVDGSTGLTPITGMSCSSQVQNRSSTENNTNNERSVGSPNLISL